MSDLFLNTVIGDTLKRAQTISQNDIFISVFSLNSVQEFIVDMNRSQMKNQYVNSEGVALSSIGGEYTDYTIQISILEGRPKSGKGNVDLHNTGEFHQSIRVTKVTENEIVIGSQPIKEDGTNLLTEWGEEILGLTAENMDKLISMVIPMYQNAVLKYLQDGTFI